MTDTDGRLAVHLDRALTNGLPVFDHECVVDVGRHHPDRSEPLEQDARIEQAMHIEAIRLAALKLLKRAGLHVQFHGELCSRRMVSGANISSMLSS